MLWDGFIQTQSYLEGRKCHAEINVLYKKFEPATQHRCQILASLDYQQHWV